MISYSGPVISSSSAEYNTIEFRIYLIEQSILQLLFQNKRYIQSSIPSLFQILNQKSYFNSN